MDMYTVPLSHGVSSVPSRATLQLTEAAILHITRRSQEPGLAAVTNLLEKQL